MGSRTAAQAGTMMEEKSGLQILLQAVPSRLRVRGGGKIPFRRAILSMRNGGQCPLAGFIPHAKLSQEGGAGSAHDASEALSRAQGAKSILPGEVLQWDVYEFLLDAHPGVAGKVHLWGYKAILNWWFELEAWAEYRTPDSAAPQTTPVARWKLRWSPLKAASDDVDLSIEP